jgi:hypothetical protein
MQEAQQQALARAVRAHHHRAHVRPQFQIDAVDQAAVARLEGDAVGLERQERRALRH